MERRPPPNKPFRKFPLPAIDESQSVVLMVYGINQDQFDCDRLFNLFCCYGNVVKVSFIGKAYFVFMCV